MNANDGAADCLVLRRAFGRPVEDRSDAAAKELLDALAYSKLCVPKRKRFRLWQSTHHNCLANAELAILCVIVVHQHQV